MRTERNAGALIVAALIVVAVPGLAEGAANPAEAHEVQGEEVSAEVPLELGDEAAREAVPATPAEATTTTPPEGGSDGATAPAAPTDEAGGGEAPRAVPSPGLLAVGMPAEVTVIGLTVGVRPELIVRPLSFARWLEFRGAVGLLAGLEYGYTPLSLGVRGRYLGGAWHPMAGIAVTEEFFWITDASPIVRTVMELDLGGSVDLSDDWAVDFIAYTGWAFVGEPGPMAGLRLGVRYDLDLD